MRGLGKRKGSTNSERKNVMKLSGATGIRFKTRRIIFTCFLLTVCFMLIYIHTLYGKANSSYGEPDSLALRYNSKSRFSSCAIMFFGLPRSFETLVLPTIIENVVKTNVRYNCDYYVHTYIQTSEVAGRSNAQGSINPNSMLLLEKWVNEVAKKHSLSFTPPVIKFCNDTEDEFWEKRGELVKKYRETKNVADGNYIYYPWKARTYKYPESIDNIVKQWHSIQSVWELMESTAKKMYSRHYKRVAMIRSDVFYAYPVDIYQTNKYEFDRNNEYVVTPAFALYPINDRMIYGPYEAVKIWATQRFQRLEEHVLTYEPGWGMHSERFLNHSIFPLMNGLITTTSQNTKKSISLKMNPDLCFFRARADTSVWISDCQTKNGTARGIVDFKKQKYVESVTGMSCKRSKGKINSTVLHCT